MINLNTIFPALGSVKLRKRVGRGSGSGLGKTSGYGHKGQSARSGVPLNMCGGQTPLSRRLPKRGFTHRKDPLHFTINTKRILELVKNQKINTSLSLQLLKDLNIIHKSAKSCKIIGNDNIGKIKVIDLTMSKSLSLVLNKEQDA
jgi:large subunit ribosomal protein L15